MCTTAERIQGKGRPWTEWEEHVQMMMMMMGRKSEDLAGGD
jgi:hypothetical protein